MDVIDKKIVSEFVNALMEILEVHLLHHDRVLTELEKRFISADLTISVLLAKYSSESTTIRHLLNDCCDYLLVPPPE